MLPVAPSKDSVVSFVGKENRINQGIGPLSGIDRGREWCFASGVDAISQEDERFPITLSPHNLRALDHGVIKQRAAAALQHQIVMRWCVNVLKGAFEFLPRARQILAHQHGKVELHHEDGVFVLAYDLIQKTEARAQFSVQYL